MIQPSNLPPPTPHPVIAVGGNGFHHLRRVRRGATPGVMDALGRFWTAAQLHAACATCDQVLEALAPLRRQHPALAADLHQAVWAAQDQLSAALEALDLAVPLRHCVSVIVLGEQTTLRCICGGYLLFNLPPQSQIWLGAVRSFNTHHPAD